MRKLIAVAVLALIAPACAASGVLGPGGGGESSPSPDQTRLDVYETTIRYLAGAENIDWENVYVRIPICENAEEPAEPKGCTDSFSFGEQTGLTERLADLGAPLVFVQGYEDLGNRILEGKERSVFVWVGPIVPDG